MYGSGLRLSECVELRVKDVHLDRGELAIRDGKGGKDRVTMLPDALRGPLREHQERRRAMHESDLRVGRGSVALTGVLATKYPNAGTEWRGSGCFRRRGSIGIPGRGSGGGTTCTRPCCSVRCSTCSIAVRAACGVRSMSLAVIGAVTGYAGNWARPS